MNLLAVETGTEACSVALWRAGELAEKHELAPRRHTRLVLPWIEQLLAEAGLVRSQLDALAVGRGPGAFTGVRLGIAIVQGLALALDRPVVPVSTLAVLAMRAPADAREILAAIDARMGEVYLGEFRRDGDGLVRAAGREQVLPPGMAPLPAASVHGVGTGFAAEHGLLAERLGDRLLSMDAQALPHAGDLARLAAAAFARGEAVPADRVEPAYLRDKVALTLAEQGKPLPDGG
ncbi:tRNA (adenosine(37)-N6)-threonylcarbamoyltransferase complex dimerization subunit type 1 TsaB [Arenimonas fontis]|uniref:tRNA threonylcarbamoyladenosine biosynthesis protein TsaB n=1 Tax=Arenimonas fontis TaxID=2608255 RepID=A0A5B2ZCT0_9GAMM|nr:tRNA (adenosine(37)-N6)-threonylcarbamoyltransferase complex dimerization subunit type 1 TsaB [Arenimonas fontis]KAA2284881.1 tRNA (adenosine(37)-N6)-threonylcarbamoyltransferase complex dimerization subunit type 1 TsaB [Arenimonas fontis]